MASTNSSSSSSSSSTFHGWIAHSATSPLEYRPFEPKPFTDTDVEIRITHCGICGSDVHIIHSGWGPTDYPCVVGHEIIGIVERVGSQVPSSQGITIGARVGVGPLSMSCLRPDCRCALQAARTTARARSGRTIPGIRTAARRMEATRLAGEDPRISSSESPTPCPLLKRRRCSAAV